MSLCQQLKTEYAEIEKLKQEFEAVFDEAVKTGKTEKAQKLKKEIQEKIATLKEKIVPKEIKAIWTNPETNEQKEISFNLQETIKNWQEFYQKHNLPIPDGKELKFIWQKNHKEIQKEMETYGYDNIIVVPENLPSTEILHPKMTEGFNASYQSDNFKAGGGFAGSKTVQETKTRIILCHSDQNIYENPDANPLAKKTLNKNILQLSGLTQPEIDLRIQNNQSIPVNFEAQINGKKIQIKSEGFSLDEYLIFQKQYFEKTQNHLDENGWTWLLKTRSGSRVVRSYWYPARAQLYVHALAVGNSYDCLGCRLSRSFSA
jgi:hypothetical protein